jgi:hypothetical protein
LRRTVLNPLPNGDVNDWNRELGVVFRHDHVQQTRTVSGEVEIGMLLSGRVGFRAYRRTGILINNRPFMAEDPDIFPVSAAEVDQFLQNMANLTRAPRMLDTRELFSGIDLSSLPTDFGDKITL